MPGVVALSMNRTVPARLTLLLCNRLPGSPLLPEFNRTTGEPNIRISRAITLGTTTVRYDASEAAPVTCSPAPVLAPVVPRKYLTNTTNQP